MTTRTRARMTVALATALMVGPLLLAGCAPAAGAGSGPGDASEPGTGASGSPSAAGESSETLPQGSAATRMPGCDAVEAVVAPYIDGLVPREDNGSDEYGTLCGWEAPEGTTDLDDVRTVEVSISPDPGPQLSAEELEAVGLTPIPDAAVDAAGGIAYSSTVEVAVAAVIVTTVMLPDVEISVTGGQWDAHPALDGPAAVDAAVRILGLD